MRLLLFLIVKFRALAYKIRSVNYFYFFKTLNIRIGQNLIIRGGATINKIGNKLTIYDNVIIESYSNDAILNIGDNCILSYGVILSCSNEISIGNDVWIGEYTSIRDSTHIFSLNTTLKENEDKNASIHIGNNVWIGRNSLILPGARIGNNVIIGANSIVKGVCEDNSLYIGTPLVKKQI